MCHATQDVFKRSPPVKSSSSLEGDAAAAAAASSRRSSARAPPNEAAVLAAAVGTYVSLSLCAFSSGAHSLVRLPSGRC